MSRVNCTRRAVAGGLPISLARVSKIQPGFRADWRARANLAPPSAVDISRRKRRFFRLAPVFHLFLACRAGFGTSFVAPHGVPPPTTLPRTLPSKLRRACSSRSFGAARGGYCCVKPAQPLPLRCSSTLRQLSSFGPLAFSRRS